MKPSLKATFCHTISFKAKKICTINMTAKSYKLLKWELFFLLYNQFYELFFLKKLTESQSQLLSVYLQQLGFHQWQGTSVVFLFLSCLAEYERVYQINENIKCSIEIFRFSNFLKQVLWLQKSMTYGWIH